MLEGDAEHGVEVAL